MPIEESTEAMKKSNKKRQWKIRAARPRYCPCLAMFTMNLKLCHFYTDLGCDCCYSRSARADGRDLKMHLELMPENFKVWRLQFRFHALKALAAERAACWSDAICFYEACRQSLANVEGKLPRSLHLWLLMWASTPLVSLYHLKSQNFTKSIEVSSMLMDRLELRMGTWHECREMCCRRVKTHFRCRALLTRTLTEILLAYEALERDRRLAYYEWSYSPGVDGEEMRGQALEEFPYGEGVLCQQLSKLHQRYGDYGVAQHWVRTRQGVDPCKGEDQWDLELYDAKLLRECGDAQGCKNKIFAMAKRLQDGKDSNPEAMAAVEAHRNIIKENHEFYGDLPVKQGKVPELPTLLQNEHRAATNWMEDAFDRGMKLMRDGMFDAAVSCFQNALDKMRRSTGPLRKKNLEDRLGFLCKLGEWFNNRFHSNSALEDLDKAISYFRKSYFLSWLQGSRADESILQLQSDLGWVYGIKAIGNYTDNMLLHDLSWNSAVHDWDYSHSKEKIKERVTSQGFIEQEYMDFRITEFIKAWRRSMKHNRIAALIMSNQLYSMRHSADQLDDTWAIYSLEENTLVYHGLQARLQEEMVLKRLLATCCKGASVKHKILKYLDRNSKSSNFPAGPFPRLEQSHDTCERFPGNGRPVNNMSPAQEALLWAERSRTNALSYQLFPHRLHGEATDKLHDFDLQDQDAWDIITEAKGACGNGTVVVEYTYSHYDQNYIAYVFDQGSLLAHAVVYGPPAEVPDYNQRYEQKDGRVAMRGCPIQDEDELEGFVSKVLSYLSEDDGNITTSESRVMEILKELYFMLIETIIDLLEHMTKEDKLVIVPIEGLTEMPFQLLLDDDGIYLFEKYIVSITPSVRTIKYLNERYSTLQSYSLLEGSGAVLVLGDPAYRNEEDRLISSNAEVEMVSSIFPERRISKLLGTEASVKNVLDWGRRPSELSNEYKSCQAFVHFATHGIVDKKYNKGALQLAHPRAQEWEPTETSDPHKDPKSSDKILEMTVDFFVEEMADDIIKDDDNENIMYNDAVAAQPSAEIGGVCKSRTRDGGSTLKDSDMLSSEGVIGCGFDWRTYMVVLSACNSAKGKVLAEGVLNLPRAFLIAGVPYIVASQWLVDDELTPKLMSEFYGLLKQGRDVATSLCLAMRRMKRSNEKQFHIWGAFNVWGLPTVCLPKELQAGYNLNANPVPLERKVADI